jgi:hypothetical protein
MNRRRVSRTASAAALTAAGSLAALGVMIGWNGASRAYSVGVHTLYRDHLAAVIVVMAASALVATLLGRLAGSAREVILVMLVVLAVDLVAALIVTLAIDELRRYPDLVRAVLAETAGGAQLIALAGGAAAGYVGGGHRVRSAQS